MISVIVLAREELLERSEAEHVVDEDLDEAQPVRPAHRDVLLGDHVVEQSRAMRWRTTSGGTELVPWASSSTRR